MRTTIIILYIIVFMLLALNLFSLAIYLNPPIQLTWASQNFGVLSGDKLLLDETNNLFEQYSHYDVFAFQELEIPNSRFDSASRNPGKHDYFGARVGLRYGWFSASSAATKKVNKTDVQHCFGMYINPNLNFDISGRDNVIDENNKGSLVIWGTLYNKYKVAFVSSHLVWDSKNGGFDNPANYELVNKLLDYIKTLKVEYYLIMGDFNIRFSKFKNEYLPKWRKIFPDIKSEVDDIEKSLCTSFDKDGFAHPDHVLTNLKIKSFKTFVRTRTDHTCISGSVEIPVPLFSRKKLVKLSATNKVKIPTELQ